jgi:hypothetical protein
VALEAQLDARDPEIDVERCPKSLSVRTATRRRGHLGPSREQAVLILLSGVNQDEPRYFVRELAIEHANVEAAKGMADQ